MTGRPIVERGLQVLIEVRRVRSIFQQFIVLVPSEEEGWLVVLSLFGRLKGDTSVAGNYRRSTLFYSTGCYRLPVGTEERDVKCIARVLGRLDEIVPEFPVPVSCLRFVEEQILRDGVFWNTPAREQGLETIFPV